MGLDVKISKQSSGQRTETLHFFFNLANKQVSYSGYSKSAVNKVAQNEFGKDADVIYSSYISPVNINVFYGGKY